MDNKKETIWSRRSNTSNLSLSTNQSEPSNTPRDYSSLSRRNGGATSSHGRSNPFNSTGPPAAGLTSPTTGGGGGGGGAGGGSNAFGLGSGAFASFGSAKTPKTPGNPFDMAMGSVGAGTKTPTIEKSSKESLKSAAIAKPSAGGAGMDSAAGKKPASTVHPLRDTWVFWIRPPISRANGYIEYEKTLHPIASVSTIGEFWGVYRHLKRPSALPLVSDYHLFKKGVRPIWEDDENKQGGKWVLRLKKGIADRYWEDILLALVGDQFSDENEEVCGVVLSVRNGEDILSIWTRTTGQKVLRIRETMRRVLNCPTETRFDYKSHDDSMAQRVQIEESRREKAANHHHGDTKRSSHHNSGNTRQSQEEQRS